MEILIVDNYDSYTYNLAHLFAEVTGREPRVVLNDAPEWRSPEAVLAGVDAVVVSPGPGRPAARDVGHSTAALGAGTIPVLGVCLGHQLLARTSGARVERAGRPQHGHVTRVRHTGRDLFAGIPQDFEAVRYHSLAVQQPVPAALEVLAWSEDREIMAVRHRRRPWWGVQFHPESISSQFGPELVDRFLGLAARALGRPLPTATHLQADAA